MQYKSSERNQSKTMVNTEQRLLTTVAITDSASNLTWSRARHVRIQPDARVLYTALRSIESSNCVLIKAGNIDIEINSKLLAEKSFVGVYKSKPVVYYVNKNSYWLNPIPTPGTSLLDYLGELTRGWPTINLEDYQNENTN